MIALWSGLALASGIGGVIVQMQGPADQPDLAPIVQVIDSHGVMVEVPLKDDGQRPDDRKGDGIWSGLAPGVTGERFTVRLPAGPDLWMSGEFTVADPYKPTVRVRPAPGMQLISFEPQAAPGEPDRPADPWAPAEAQAASQRPGAWWLAPWIACLVGLGWGIRRWAAVA